MRRKNLAPGAPVPVPALALALAAIAIATGTTGCEDKGSFSRTPCETYCDRVYQCCTDLGAECGTITAECMLDCDEFSRHLEASNIDLDQVSECMRTSANCLQLVGLDDGGLLEVYSGCVAEATDCTYTGSCAPEGDTRCCGGAQATCVSGEWLVLPCQTICEDWTPETPVFTGVCANALGHELCGCEAA